MKKEIIDMDGVKFPVYSLNTLIIGSGASGLNAAIHLWERGQKDIAIATDCWGGGTSNNAGSDKQTYYKLSLSSESPDSPLQMAQDLFAGGCMHGDIALCEAQNSLEAFFHLVRLGVPFPHNQYGAYVGYKTDHDPLGRGTSAGPLTSHLMFEALAREVKSRGIAVFDGCEVMALLAENKDDETHVIGALALDRNNCDAENLGFIVYNAKNVVLGTGGPAGIYKASVYPESQLGSTGLALAIGTIAHNLTESQYGLASVKFRWNLSGSYQQVIPRYVSAEKDGSDLREFLNDYFPDMGRLATAIFLKGYQWPFDPRKIRDFGSSLIDILVYQESVLRGRRVFLDFTRNPSGGGILSDFSFDLLGEEASQYLQNSDALYDTPIHAGGNVYL
jgi:succinate dehydrogenase/fumarate reductase flavoprotein subunit